MRCIKNTQKLTPLRLLLSSHLGLSQFEKLAVAVEMPELSQDPRFRTNKDRTEHRKILIDLLQTFFDTKTRVELDAIFEVRP
jgi:crotonobetainyl-CoA:carnitine CoA-transferase CaiB-like acyl-CoA transferase